MYEFLCNTKQLFYIAKELFIQAVRVHGSPELPIDLEKMGIHIVEFEQRYIDLLKTLCDDLPKALE